MCSMPNPNPKRGQPCTKCSKNPISNFSSKDLCSECSLRSKKKYKPKSLKFSRFCVRCKKTFLTADVKTTGCAKCRASRPKCKCGCGGYVRCWFSTYIAGHVPETLQSKRNGHRQQSKAISGNKNPSKRLEVRAKLSSNYSGSASKQSRPEAILHNLLDKRKFKYTGLGKRLYGEPISSDILCSKLKLIIQVDGCHWHECPLHGSGKYKHKQIRDIELTEYAEERGWTVLRFWEHQIYNEPVKVVKQINQTVRRLS